MNKNQLLYKIASEEHEFEQIHRLNHQTFVEEIPQHLATIDGCLIDRFHSQNTYVICLSELRLVGMVALRGVRPFSLDQKIANLDEYLPVGRRLCEIRLLAVEPDRRNTTVLFELLRRLVDVAASRGYDMALISGTTRQSKLYAHLGFVPFAQLIGHDNAQYQPMCLSIERFRDQVQTRLPKCTWPRQSPAIFLPGPVAVHSAVLQAFNCPPVSHRDAEFQVKAAAIKQRLRELTGATDVALMLGSGTLANDAVAGQLALGNSAGMVLSNGEFGERLMDHAARWNLQFETIRQEWGAEFDISCITAKLAANPEIEWVWMVHCETSTGMINPLAGLASLCKKRSLKLYIDAISSLGAIPFSMDGVGMATGVSGKGLGAFPGIALVLSNERVPPPERHLPRYLDLSLYFGEAPPFTQSSNLVAALHAALQGHFTTRQQRIVEAGTSLRYALRKNGFELVGSQAAESPAVITISLPRAFSSVCIGGALREKDIHIAYASDYLQQRNWIQICLFGEFSQQGLVDVVEALTSLAT